MALRWRRWRGSQTNDPITPEGFASNHMGGMLGGISSGAPVVVRAGGQADVVDSARAADHRHRWPAAHDQGAGPPRSLHLSPRGAGGRGHGGAGAVRCLFAAAGDRRGERRRAAAGRELAFCDAEILRLVDRRRRVAQAAGATSEQLQRATQQQRLDEADELGFDQAAARQLFAAVERMVATAGTSADVSGEDGS